MKKLAALAASLCLLAFATPTVAADRSGGWWDPAKWTQIAVASNSTAAWWDVPELLPFERLIRTESVSQAVSAGTTTSTACPSSTGVRPVLQRG
jgi:hypothetical protein